MQAFINGTFLSCEEEQSTFSVMVTNEGRIVYTGDTLPEAYANAKKVDLQGAAVVPAFADTHMHFESYALFHSTVDVRDAADFEDMGRMLKKYASEHPRDKVIAAYGCSAHVVKEKRLAARQDLDQMTRRPLLIVKYDGHAAVANSALVALLPKDVTGDPGFDRVTGWMYQNAFYKGVNFITSQIPIPRILKGLVGAANELTRQGIGLVHSVEGVGYQGDIDVDMLRMLRFGLPQAFRIFFQTMDVEKVKKRRMNRIGGCFKLALDGCFGSEDAALFAPYDNNPDNTGFLAYTQEEVNAFCRDANRAGMQIAMHAIGDKAVEQALTALEAALSDSPREDHRHIIIHADLITNSQMERAAAMKVCVALQPAFLDWRQEPAEYLERILGRERALAIEPLRSLTEHGILISAGSDAPCTLPNPLESIHLCCNHPDPAQSVTVWDALKMHTLWAAKMSFDEENRGSLTVGKFADFAVLAKDPLTMPIDRLRENSVLALYLAGQKVGELRGGMGGLITRAAASYLSRKSFA